MWDKITYLFPNFNGCTGNFIPHFPELVITYPWLNHVLWRQPMKVATRLYIPWNMDAVLLWVTLLCVCVFFGDSCYYWPIFLGLHHWHWGNRMIVAVNLKNIGKINSYKTITLDVIIVIYCKCDFDPEFGIKESASFTVARYKNLQSLVSFCL